MAFVGNLLWFIIGGGFFAWLGWLVLGLLLCCTVIGIPFGIAAFRIAGFAAFPFGKELVSNEMIGEKHIMVTGLANFLWIRLAGIWLAIGYLFSVLHVYAVSFLCCLFFGGWPISSWRLSVLHRLARKPYLRIWLNLQKEGAQIKNWAKSWHSSLNYRVLTVGLIRVI